MLYSYLSQFQRVKLYQLKPLGKNVFKRHNETVSGNGNIEPLPKRKKTICDDHFYCPRC